MPAARSRRTLGGASGPGIGRTLAGKYRLEELLGEGGMGSVYRARQIALDKAIAVKVMHADLASDPLFVARFHREAMAASRLDHANSVRVIDFGEEPDGVLYLAMELLDGSDLLTILDREGPLSTGRVVDLVSQILSALAAAHDAGIIHRDLKPENIMILRRRGEEGVEQEVIKICDFGIAQMADAASGEDAPARAKRGKLTAAGLVIGTPDYMSPEQGRGEPLDARTDLYSIGVLLYLLLTDRRPFDAPTAMSIVMKHQTQAPVPPSALRPNVDAGLEEVCLRAMQKRRDDRFASAREMRGALRSALTASPPSGARARIRTGAATTPPDLSTLPTTALAEARTKGPAPKAAGAAMRVAVWAAVGVGAVVAGAFLAHGGAPPTAPARRAEVSVTMSDPSSRAIEARLPVEAPSLPAPSEIVLPETPTDSPPARRRRTESRATAVPLDAPREELQGDAPPSAAPLAPSARASADRPPPAAPSGEGVTSVDAAGARVTAGKVVVLGGGARTSEVTAVVRDAMARINACYRDAATATTPVGTWTLALTTDDDGNVQPSRLDGPLPSGIKACVAEAPRGKVHADTGAVTAEVRLTFR